MRALVAFSALALVASPAVAQQPQPQPQPQPQADRGADWQLPAELFDPAMGERISQMLGVLTGAMMDLPVGEMQAAVEGRAPTSADRSRTIRDLAGRDRNFDRKVQDQVASALPRMQATMKAMAASMPSIIGALEKAADDMGREIDRATVNLPQPGYPNR